MYYIYEIICHINDKKYIGQTKRKISKTMKERGISKGQNNPMFGVSRYGKDNPFFGKKHNKETVEKIKETLSRQEWKKYNNCVYERVL